jgi:Fibronectin type III domain/Metallo-peptidase family M12B Reprolysin-like
MNNFRRQRLVAATTTVCIVFIGALAGSGAGATPSPARGDGDRLPDLIAGRDRQFHGRAALDALGDQLPEAARRNGMAAERLHEILTRDPSAWLDQDARLLYEEPERTEGATSSPTAEAAAPAPLDQTFQLHSKPGSQRTIYLDFNGQTVSNTIWNVNHGLAAGSHPAWSLDKDHSTFTTPEREAVQNIWQRVSEDYAPFDVDVTTQDPGATALTRTDSADQVFGTRALITPSASASNKLCGGSCGGMAYTGVFDVANSEGLYQPAWIFPQSLANDAKSIAEAVSHEVGHNLGLTHDGLTGGTSYYAGHAIWAPIMGIGYSRPVTQWSKGDYKGANNGQDDLSVITDNGLALRPDEAGSTPSPTTAPPTGSAYITSDADRDVYALGICSGPLSLAADSASSSPDLDLKLSLLDVTGGTMAVDNPTSRAGNPSRDVAIGMNATVSRTVAEDWYFVSVEGVGNGSPSKGYDGYASVGAYALSLNGSCQSPSDDLPSAPRTVEGSTDGSTATVEWTAPRSAGTSSITHYVVTRDGAAPAAVTGQAYTFTGLQPGAIDNVAVQAVNLAGEGAPAAIRVKVPAAKPGRTRIRSAGSGATGGKVTAVARWQAPRSDGGARVTAYRVYGYRMNARGVFVQKVTSVRTATARSWQPTLSRGRWKFAVRARNGIGWGTISARSNTVTAR